MEDIVRNLSQPLLVIGAVTLFLASFSYMVLHGHAGSKNSLLPPGPPRDFLLGNLRQFPKDHFFRKFCEWQREYGDIVSIQLPGVPMVVINTYELAQDLLVKRPNTTAGRQIGYMVRELMGWHWLAGLIQPGPHHSEQRKMLRRGIGPQRVGSHTPKIEKNTTKLMLALRGLQGNPHSEILRAVGRIVIEITYGEKVHAVMGKELSSWNVEALEMINEAFVAFWFVDVVPILRFIPSWFPGAGFRRLAKRSSWISDQIRHVPFARAKELYDSGEIGHSLATDLLDEFGPNEDVRDALAVLYTAGADTTSAAILMFFHAMFLFPEVAQRVYEEIVAVTGGDREPTVADRSSLPYTEAVWKESYRWRVFAPTGIPHLSTQDEMVNGYTIKAGTLIMQNNGFMLADPKVWGDPETFRPDRFLGSEGDSLPNPQSILFGYGMRVCPGMYLADRIGFHVAATMTALYDIVPLEGQDRPKPDIIEYSDTAIILPLNFECRFVPRNKKAEDLLKSSAMEY